MSFLVFGLLGAFLVGCAAQNMQTPLGSFSPKTYPTGHYASKVDNFLVILDASSSMAEPHGGRAKFTVARAVADRLNRTLPDLKIKGALSSFGHSPMLSREKTQLAYGLTDYMGSGFKGGLDKVSRAGGTTPMTAALLAGIQDLSGAAGKIAVILISDGKSTDSSPVAAARMMKEKFGDRLCIYTVQVGDDPAGKSTLDQVVKAGDCGFAVNADDILSAGAMADYVEKVFLTRYIDSDGDGVFDYMDKCPGTPAGVKVDADGCPLDTDGDGVYDYLDKCPGTPAGVKVDSVGCPLDTDGDGVYDYMDKCPGTPSGAKVNSDGCWVLGDVLFDFDKSVIKPAASNILDNAVMVLKNNPDLRVELGGHTDSIGTESYNMGLSQRRVNAVKAYLVQAGIAESRLMAQGYGEVKPVATNKTSDGRALNRRVEIMPIR